MSQIFITGDCHGDYTRFATHSFPTQKELTRDDFVIVAGDFGYWDNSPEQRYWRKWLSKKSFTILFVDGNHENFDMLNALPIEEWHGGFVHRISENIIHLMRGQVFNINSQKWFTMGGAPSHDIQDGILDPAAADYAGKRKALIKAHAMFRTKGISWWPEEMFSEEEKEEAIKNLSKVNYHVDYIITHEAPQNIVFQISNGRYAPNPTSQWLYENLFFNVKYKKWFCGHHHQDQSFANAKVYMYYHQIDEIT